ncbi:MAG: polyhydroxybutyrate depolymerase, partial [Chloroflexi bacterium]
MQLSLEHAGITRTCRVHRPVRLSSRPGLVVLLHGAVGSGAEFAEDTGFDGEADRLGWVAAYPDAL